MNDQEYREAVDACLQAARGGGEHWNERFVNALAAHGLKLVPAVDKHWPNWPKKDYYVLAPQPFSEGLPVWPISYIEEVKGE